MAKALLYSDDARSRLLSGISKLASAVKTTLGPRGRNVIIERSYGPPQIVNDGVTIAREMTLSDPFENMGAELIKEVATKTNDKAGDGTTTATILTEAIFKEGLKNLVAGANPMRLKAGILKAAAIVTDELTSMKRDVKDNDIERVATISAQDAEVGKLIAEAIEKIGDSPITTEEGQSGELALEVKEGMQWPNGFVAPWMVRDPARLEAVVQNVRVLVTSERVTFTGALEAVKKILPDPAGVREWLIIAEEFDNDALGFFFANHMQGNFRVIGVRAPGFGDQRRHALKDIAILTGATLISKDEGRTLDTTTVQDLGSAGKVIVTKDSTMLVDGKGKEETIAARVESIEAEIENTKSDMERARLQERKAKLAGGVAVIKVGASTDTEMREKKLRIEDAINATRAAVDEGIVPGGGVALLRARAAVLKASKGKGLSDEERAGMKIVAAALTAPVKQIAENAGVSGDVVVDKLGNEPAGVGWNAENGEYVDMFEAGIIDPLRVTRSALQFAATNAAMILTTECAIVEEREKGKTEAVA